MKKIHSLNMITLLACLLAGTMIRAQQITADPNKFQIRLSYNYLTQLNGSKQSFPLGFELGAGLSVNQNLRITGDVSIHSYQQLEQTYQQINAKGGVEFQKQDPDKRPPISTFARIAIGMMSERVRSGQTKSSGSAPMASAGGGWDFRFSPRAAVRISGDYFIVFINGNPQHNLGAGLGLNFGLSGSKH